MTPSASNHGIFIKKRRRRSASADSERIMLMENSCSMQTSALKARWHRWHNPSFGTPKPCAIYPIPLGEPLSDHKSFGRRYLANWILNDFDPITHSLHWCETQPSTKPFVCTSNLAYIQNCKKQDVETAQQSRVHLRYVYMAYREN